MLRIAAAAWVVVLLLLIPSTGSAAPLFAVWLEGCTETNTIPGLCPNGGTGGNGIPFSLTEEFGPNSYTLVTTAQLETAGFLDPFKAVVISRFGHTFGDLVPLTPGAVTNIQNYVGSGPSQGGVAVFTNDAADSLCNPNVFLCPPSPDSYDPNLNQLFMNAAALVAATGHGYLGELNGAIMAFSNPFTSSPLPAIGLLPGSSTGVQVVMQTDPNNPVGFIYQAGPIGTGHAIDAGVTFPFTTTEHTLNLGKVTGFDSGNVVDQYGDNGLDDLGGLPAIAANEAVIGGVVPPPQVPAPPSLVLLGLGLIGLATWKRGRRNCSLDN